MEGEALFAAYCDCMHPNDPDKWAELLARLRDDTADVTDEQMRQEVHDYKLRCEGDWGPLTDLSDRQYER